MESLSGRLAIEDVQMLPMVAAAHKLHGEETWIAFLPANWHVGCRRQSWIHGGLFCANVRNHVDTGAWGKRADVCFGIHIRIFAAVISRGGDRTSSVEFYYRV